MPRTSIEYGGCSLRKRSTRRSRATHWASTIWPAEYDEAPNIIVPRQSFETWTPVRPSGRYSIALGLRDRHAESLERDRVGLRAAAAAGVQRVDRGELVVGQLEVEDADVLGDAVRLGGL